MPPTTLVAAARERRTRERRIVLGLGVAVAAIAAVVTLLIVFWPAAPDAPHSTIAGGRISGSPTASAAVPEEEPTFDPTAGSVASPQPAMTQPPALEPSPTQTDTPQPTPTARPTLTPKPTETSSPSPTPAPPSATPTPAPTEAPTAAETPSPTPPLPAGGDNALWRVVHIVQEAETLGRIAARYDSDVDAIVTMNDLDDPNTLLRGQVLTIPLSTADAVLAASPILTGSLETTEAGQEPALPVPTLLPTEAQIPPGAAVNLEWQWEQELGEGQYFAVSLRWEEQPGPCCLILTREGTLALDLKGYALGTYSWTVRVAEGTQVAQLRILERFVTGKGQELEFTWPGSEQ